MLRRRGMLLRRGMLFRGLLRGMAGAGRRLVLVLLRVDGGHAAAQNDCQQNPSEPARMTTRLIKRSHHLLHESKTSPSLPTLRRLSHDLPAGRPAVFSLIPTLVPA